MKLKEEAEKICASSLIYHNETLLMDEAEVQTLKESKALVIDNI